jgi:hypothetical protein
MNILELCKCNGANICTLCMILTAISILVLGFIFGYFTRSKKK